MLTGRTRQYGDRLGVCAASLLIADPGDGGVLGVL